MHFTRADNQNNNSSKYSSGILLKKIERHQLQTSSEDVVCGNIEQQLCTLKEPTSKIITECRKGTYKPKLDLTLNLCWRTS